MSVIGDGQPGAPAGQPTETAAPATATAPAATDTTTTDPAVAPASKHVDASVIAAVGNQGAKQPEAATPPTTPPATPPGAPAATPPGTPPGASNIYEQVRGAKLTDILSDEFKNDPNITRIADVDNLAKSFIESRKYISQAVKIPDADATEEERAEFYKKLGRPEKAEEYTLELKPEYKEKGINIDNTQAQWYKELALKANLTSEQAKIVFENYVDKEVNGSLQMAEQQKELTAKTIDGLKGVWRSQYNDNINLINSNLDKFFSKDVQATLTAKGLFSDQAFIESMLDLTKKVTGSNMFIESGSTAGQQTELQGLEAKRRELMLAPDRRQRKAEEFDLNKRIAEIKDKQQQLN